MKNTIKKAISVLLVAVMVFGAAPLAGFVGIDLPELNLFNAKAEAATYGGTCGKNLTWTFDELTCELVISGTGKMADWEFSSYAPWEKYNSSIRSVIIDDGVTSIGDYAFYFCTKLTSVIIPDNVTSIGDCAFYNCERITSITIPDSVTSIGDYAFYCCNSLTSILVDSANVAYSSDEYGVLFNKNKTELIQYPIGNKRTSYAIPDGVTSIGDYAFYWCKSLTNITIPDSVTSVGDRAFSYCTVLTSISIPNRVTNIGAYAFGHCESLTSMIIPDSVTSIGDYVFYGCYSLASVTMGNGVTSIGDCAFLGCDKLTSITLPESVTTIGKSAFESTSLSEIIIPDGTTDIGYRAFYDCVDLKTVEISDSVTIIGDNAFYDCVYLETVTVGKGIETIGYNAFFDCVNIADVYYNGTELEWNEITIDEGNEALLNANIHFISTGKCGENLTYTLNLTTGELVISGTGDMFDYSLLYPTFDPTTPWFSERSKIKTVIIEDGITNIGDLSFQDCTNLTSITIPDSVTSIGDSAFENCISLINIEIPKSVTDIGTNAFKNCNGLQNITVDKNNLYYLSDEYGVLFDKYKTTLISYPAGNTQTSYVIPDSVTSINSFGNAESLTSVTIPVGVTKINSGTFSYCTSLKEVTMPISFDYYPKGAFSTSVEKIILTKGNDKMPDFSYDYPPDYDYTGNIKVYGSLPWTGIKSITEIIICDGVTNIGSYAFYGSDAKITIPDSVTQIGYNAFSDRVEVYYSGMVEQWKQIAIDKHNENLFKNVIIDYKSDNACYGAGDCGDNLSWILYVDGKFEISGTGDMENWASLSDVPWDYRRSEIKEISVPGEVTSISPYAFSNCANLEKVEILGYSVEIADNAFSNSPNVILYCKSGSTVQSYAELNNLMYVLIDGSTADFAVKNNQLVAYKGSSANPKIPSGVTSIGANAFNGNETVKTLELPTSVTSIFSGAFADCSALEEIFIPHTVTTIAADAFNGTNAKIVCYANSTAHRFAVDNGIEFELVKVILNETELVLKVGEYSIITAIPEQEYIESVEISWKSSDTSVATVDGNGKVTAKSNGEVTIFALAPNGATLATCSVNVILNEYKVLWVVDGNTTTQNFEVGKAIVVPANPTKSGYKFVGWTPDVPSVMPAYDLTFTAVFELSGPVKADIIMRPTQTTINYGDAIILHVDASKIPAGGRVEWTASNGNFSCSANGTTCEIRPEKSGDTTFTATIYDAKGNAVSTDEQTMTSKAGFFDKIIAFFKKLFGLTKTIPEAIKGIY